MSAIDPSYTSTTVESSGADMDANGPVDTEEEQRRRQIEQNQGLIRLLRSWREEGDVEQQKEAWEFISRALDEDRLSDRKFYQWDE